MELFQSSTLSNCLFWITSRKCPQCADSRRSLHDAYWKVSLSNLGFDDLICWAVEPMWQVCLECQVGAPVLHLPLNQTFTRFFNLDHHVYERTQESFFRLQNWMEEMEEKSSWFSLPQQLMFRIADSFPPKDGWRETADDSQLDHTYFIAASCSARDCAAPPVCVPVQGEAA